LAGANLSVGLKRILDIVIRLGLVGVMIINGMFMVKIMRGVKAARLMGVWLKAPVLRGLF
jgi:hypothetical protein